MATSESDDDASDTVSGTAVGGGEECFMGPGKWKELMERNPTTQVFKENYENSLRSYEIKQYIDDNRDDLGVPDYFDEDIILCGIGDDVAEKERATGTQYTGEQLDTSIKLALMSKMGDAASRLLENPDQYMTP